MKGVLCLFLLSGISAVPTDTKGLSQRLVFLPSSFHGWLLPTFHGDGIHPLDKSGSQDSSCPEASASRTQASSKWVEKYEDNVTTIIIAKLIEKNDLNPVLLPDVSETIIIKANQPVSREVLKFSPCLLVYFRSLAALCILHILSSGLKLCGYHPDRCMEQEKDSQEFSKSDTFHRLPNTKTKPKWSVDQISGTPGFFSFGGVLEVNQGSPCKLTAKIKIGNFSVSSDDKKLYIRADFEIIDLKFHLEYQTRFMYFWPIGNLVGSISNVSMLTDIIIDFSNNEIKLQDFYMYNFGEIYAKLIGHPWTDFISNIFVNMTIKNHKNTICKDIEKKVKEALQEKIDHINPSIGAKRFLQLVNMQLK